MKILLLAVSVFMVIAVPAFAVDTAPSVSIATDGPTDIGAGKEYSRRFTLTAIPAAPKLVLQFSAIKKGTCPTTYRPTEVWLNGSLAKKIDFRPMALGAPQSLAIDIPAKTLRVGENKVEISGGSCQFGPDVMRLNAINIGR
jgi:hypothetical protein